MVVDELLELSGTQQYDAYQDSMFTLRIEILLHTLDYPGIGKVLKVSGSGAYNACVWCNIKGMSLQCITHVATYNSYILNY